MWECLVFVEVELQLLGPIFAQQLFGMAYSSPSSGFPCVITCLNLWEDELQLLVSSLLILDQLV